MKLCTTCGEVFPDTDTRCIADGTALSVWRDDSSPESAETVPLRAGRDEPRPAAGGDDKPALAPGRVLGGRYELKKWIGVGGFGAVFEAEDRKLRKRVAVKVLSAHVASRADVIARFEREAIAASQVGHESIVDVTDFDRDADGTHFIVMEYLDGRNLAQAIAREGPLAPPRALAIGVQVARALAAAHARGIFHRDLKPANIYLVTRGGRADYVKILDFGISKIVHIPADQGGLTSTGQVLGTPFYMSPEQASGDREVDGRTDVYSLGVILYEMLVKRVPFTGKTYLNVITQHLTRPPQPPSQVDPALALPPELDALVLRALAKDPDRRFAAMGELGDALAAALVRLDPTAALLLAPTPTTPLASPAVSTPVTVADDEPAAAPPPSTLGGASGQLRAVSVTRRARPALWAALAVVIAGAATLLWVMQSPSPDYRRGPASSEPGPAPAGEGRGGGSPVTRPVTPTPPSPDYRRGPASSEPGPVGTGEGEQADAAVPRMIEIVADADGAEVVGVGATPVRIAAPLGDEVKSFTVRAKGRKDARVDLRADSPARLEIKLDKARKPARPDIIESY